MNIFLLILAAVLALLASVGVSHPKVNFGWLSLMFFEMSFIPYFNK